MRRLNCGNRSASALSPVRYSTAFTVRSYSVSISCSTPARASSLGTRLAYASTSERSTCASVFSTSSMMSRKIGVSANIRRSIASPRSPRTERMQLSALPTPYHPGTRCRFCVHANTHGIARRSASERVPPRRAGREPMFSSCSSSSGVAAV